MPKRSRVLHCMCFVAVLGTAVIMLSVSASLRASRAAPASQRARLRVLFIGNSLTASNELPAMVKKLAAECGVAIEYRTCTPGGVSLEDHWDDGHCRKLVARERWDFVVLQQGPSSRPENRANLRTWAIRWAEVIRAAGAKSALYMVWPYEHQKNGFEQVGQSYRAAADAAGGLVLPAGEAWRDHLAEQDPIALYTSDRLHPTPAGSFLAALVIAERLTGSGGAPADAAGGRAAVVDLPAVDVQRLRNVALRVCKNEVTAKPGPATRP